MVAAVSVGEFVSVHLFDDRPGIGTVVLARPPSNVLTRQMYRELIAASAEVDTHPDVAAVVLFGGHEIFSAGDDPDEFAHDPAVELRRRAVDAVAAIPKPTVAAVTGYALGGALGLALAADWRVSGDNARFGCTETLAGRPPAPGVADRLPRLIGPSRAKEVVFSGRFVDAREALDIGLLDQMVAPDAVYDAAAEWAARFVDADPAVMAAAKTALDAGFWDTRR